MCQQVHALIFFSFAGQLKWRGYAPRVPPSESATAESSLFTDSLLSMITNNTIGKYELVYFVSDKTWLNYLGANQMIGLWGHVAGGGAMVCFEEKKLISKKWWKNSSFSKLKNEKFVHNTGRTMGLYGGGKNCLFLCLRGKKVCFWLGVKKKVCTGEKNHSPPPHIASGLPLTITLPLLPSLGLFQKLSWGGTFFFRPLHPQDTHGVRAPQPPGHVSALINPPHYVSNTPWPPGQVTLHPLIPETCCQQNTLPSTGQKSACGPRTPRG